MGQFVHYSQILQKAYGDCECACHKIPGIRHSGDTNKCCSPDDPKPTKATKDPSEYDEEDDPC